MDIETRRNKLFGGVIHGKLALTRLNNKFFLEAIYTSEDAAGCISKVIASQKGLPTLQAAMRFDLTPIFFNSHATALLEFLAKDQLIDIGGGSYLQKILLAIVDPPYFWDAYTQSLRTGMLQENAHSPFAWLLLQLMMLPDSQASTYIEIAKDSSILNPLLSSPSQIARKHAQKIKHIIDTRKVGSSIKSEYGPGGRHDNDFVDFRQISIMPTADELDSKEPPFLRSTKVLDGEGADFSRVSTHLDNQFRLNREDMLYEMREESQIIRELKQGKRRNFVVDGLQLLDIYCEDHQKNRNFYKCRWGIQLRSRWDLWHQVKSDRPDDRKKHVAGNRQTVLRHQSIACLIADEDIVAFPCINRVEDLLALNPPVIVLQLEGKLSTVKTLLKLTTAKHIRLLQIDTPIFAYEPILKALQEKKMLALSPELLEWESDSSAVEHPDVYPIELVQSIENAGDRDLKPILGTSKSVNLDRAQTKSLLSGLTQKLSLIQGPPGTGKSYIGAILAKCIHDRTDLKILVVCYTNHALDQFLEDLMDIGIPTQCIVRLGGKASEKTASLSLYNQLLTTSNFKLTRADWSIIDELKTEAEMLKQGLACLFERYREFHPNCVAILEYLEFEHPEYYAAFFVPEDEDGMEIVGRKGRKIGRDYLLERWIRGEDAGRFSESPDVQDASEIWETPRDARRNLFTRWKEEVLKESVEEVHKLGSQYNECLTKIEKQFNQGSGILLRSMRIIGCTTTGAAKYREEISAAHTDVLLVEEAGEILESHILTALGEETKQLILIGDHKQLRPKVNNYKLTVEKGEGYDLNRSLFERLVLQGYPHTTLREQHRMRPEISKLVRELTYPELRDAPKTHGRPNLRGVRDDVVFINHEHPEDDFEQAEDRRDINAKSSKQNKFEVNMVLKILRYLGQQGYGTDKVVILTPYLGQLRRLQEALKKDNDPVLSDLDSYDLVRAGLMSESAAKFAKKPIRLATIDNYQGEESDIVLISLTRSNSANDIGFMSATERLTVLLSRARNGLIMIGNANTFANARKGSEKWTQLFEILKRDGHFYDGLPVKCERHPTRTALLKTETDFDSECPDGGCREPCTTMLSCSLHLCPSECHQLSDHSQMACTRPMTSTCPKGHRTTWLCHKGQPSVCHQCEIERKKKEAELAEQARKDAEQEIHDRKMAELNEQIAQELQKLQEARIAEGRKRAITQRMKDLKDAVARASNPLPSSSNPPAVITRTQTLQPTAADTKIVQDPAPVSSQATLTPFRSAQRERWLRQKTLDGAINEHIDKIMDMTGLEDVKRQVLDIKAKVDTSKRQGTSVQDERFNVAMLGNPGTGKTTVARLYGKFLASVQVLPGDQFVETTGSRLTNDGVPGFKKLLEGVLNAGGGTIFVDEAYQLTSKSSFQGNQIMDFLLAEMENNIGKLCFIVAGYDREMESFFEHNPGLNSRVPYRLKFKDYEDAELLDMLENLVKKKWTGRMIVEGGGIKGLYGRIAIRRLGSGRGRPGFGNARAVANMFAKIKERQAARIDKERENGQQPDDFLLSKEDLIGPDPSKVMGESKAWARLQSMIGLGAVKKAVADLFFMTNTNYQRELLEKKPQQVSLNRVFLGNPGTGKTTVAKLYGQILADLGLISNGEVVVKNPSDFIGSALGQSESQTKAILASTVGKVLVIDEAYMLYGGTKAGGTDIYKTAVIDTIVAEVQSTPGEDRCVLLLGYKEQIEDMFQNVNPGLSRRFAIENAFHFHDYTDSELMQALEFKLKDQDLTATDAAKTVAMEVLGRARNRPHFGNIGEVENLLTEAKTRYQSRQATLPPKQRSPDAPFEPQDFDPDFNRNENAETNLETLFADVVGSGDVVRKLGGYQQMAKTMKARGLDYRTTVPTNFVFKGPPGTGKTTTARKMGQVYYDMGFLSSTEVIECSASDLVGQYVGQTGPKTKALLEKALGRVLFVDEAYRLTEGHFAKEAMDELVGLLTQQAFRGKLVVILAGYDKEINQLLSVNPGLSSRFPEEIVFSNMSPAQCLDVLKRKLSNESIHLDALDDPSSEAYAHMIHILEELSQLPSWGNARDMETLAKRMARAVFTTPSSADPATSTDRLTISKDRATKCLEAMLTERKDRAANKPVHVNPMHNMLERLAQPPLPSAPPQPKPQVSAATEKVAKTFPSPFADITDEDKTHESFDRDAGVTDEVWEQLQIDRRAAEEAGRQSLEREKTLQKEVDQVETRERDAQALEMQLATLKGRSSSEEDELMRKREQARLKVLAARVERAKQAAALEEVRKQQREEAKVQRKLREMGVCVAGFRWIKQESGYRCAGGSHFVSNGQLGVA